jgi:hypothetical protein
LKFSRKIRFYPEADFGEILNEFWKILHENFSKLMEYCLNSLENSTENHGVLGKNDSDNNKKPKTINDTKATILKRSSVRPFPCLRQGFSMGHSAQFFVII